MFVYKQSTPAMRHSTLRVLLWRIDNQYLKRAIDEHEYATGVGVYVGMHGTGAGDTGPSSAQALVRDDEFAFENINELREFMFMHREPCAGLEAYDLHLQTAGHRNVFDGNAGCECGRLPGQVIARQTQKFTVIKLYHGVHPLVPRMNIGRVTAFDRGLLPAWQLSLGE